MNDRKLLELAAKAVGINHPGGEHCINGPALWDCTRMRWWRPLTDDGDALRLAAGLRLSIDHAVTSMGSAWVVDGRIEEPVIGDLCSSLRRAIVRAAAAIGEAMQ